MDEKFPYGYDVNAYIDKAFELLKADFPWATREMIAEHTLYGIAKVGGKSAHVQAGNRSAGGLRTFFIPASYLKLPWDEFLDKYLELVSPSPFYVGRKDLENCPRLKDFLGFK